MKKDILEKIYQIVGSGLEKESFKPNKALNLYKYNSKSYSAEFVFDIKNRGNSYFQHIKFKFTYKPLEKVFKGFDNKLRLMKGGEAFSFNRSSLEITDWQSILKKHNIETLSFWFKTYDSIGQVEEDGNQYLQFVNLVIELKCKLQNTEFLKDYLLDNYTEYHLRQYLCLTYMNDESLEDAYQKVKEISKDYLDHLKKDLQTFYEMLKEEKVTRGVKKK